MLKSLPRNVWILTIAQAFMMTTGSLTIFVGGIVGVQLAPSEKWATLPIASLIIGTALSSIPVTQLMKIWGRKRSFVTLGVYAIIMALLACYSIYISSFTLFCLSIGLLGIMQAGVAQYRFAAMESVPSDRMANAASTVLIGGIAAAFLGPEAALFGKSLLGVEFAGSYICLAVLYSIGLTCVLFFRNPTSVQDATSSSARPISVIAKQPVFWVALLAAAIGYCVMAFIMTATPVSMHVMDGHSLAETKWVIQSHIISMFLPSLVSGWLINRLGLKRMMYLGLLAYVICIAIAWSGHHIHNYWFALVLLGVGWNFLYVSGTVLLPQSYKKGERYKVQAVNEFSVFTSQAIASLSAGWVVFELGWQSLLLISAPLLLIQVVAIVRWKKHQPQKAVQ